MAVVNPAALSTPAPVKAVFVALGTLATASITLITTFQLVSWTPGQTALVAAEAAAVIGFVSALTMHLLPSTKKEPVALAATFTAAVSATLALGTGFSWWTLSADEISALIAVLSAVIGLGTAWLARQSVTPTTGPK